MKKTYTFFILLIICPFVLKSQTSEYLTVPERLNEQCKQSFIDDLNEGVISLDDLNSTSKRDWKVYADREGVQLKNSYNGSNNGDKLRFMQPLWVTDVRGKWLEVANTRTDEKLGWVEARYLILSSYSLKTEGKISIPRKSIILTSLDELVEGGVDPKEIEDQKHFYDDPSPQTGNLIKTPLRFTILFTLKEQDGSVLLCKNDVLDGSDIENKNLVLGWIPKANVTTWSSRAMVEPTSDMNNPHAQGKNLWPGYKDLSKMSTFLKNNFYSKDGRFIEYKAGKIHAFRMRFPVLDLTDHAIGVSKNIKMSLDQQIKEAGLNIDNVKPVVSIAKDVSGESNDVAELDRVKEDLVQKSKETNIIFAIDATLSMEPYKKAVSRTIKRIVDENERLGQHSVRFGLILYRDYEDGRDSYQVEQLTNDYDYMSKRIGNIICKSKDDDDPEAQYQGLVEGLKRLNLNEKRSNVLVVIGDCGNHKIDKKGYKLQDVADVLIEKNINLISFQVISKNKPTYSKFNRDALKLIKLTSDSKIPEAWRDDKDKLSKELIRSKDRTTNTQLLKWRDGASKCDFQNMFGKGVFAVPGSDMNEQLLETSIVTTLSEYMSTVDNRISILEDVMNGGEGCGVPSGIKVAKPPWALIAYLIENFGWSEQEAIDYLQRNEVTVKAFVAMNNLKGGKIGSSEENALRYVVFLTHKEFLDLKNELSALINSSPRGSSEKKKEFQEKMSRVVENILGNGVTSSTIEELTLNDIWKIVFGFEFKNKILRNKTLNDLSSVNPIIFNRFWKNFISASETFTDQDYIHTNPYKSRQLIINRKKFYWVPIEDLPGTRLE